MAENDGQANKYYKPVEDPQETLFGETEAWKDEWTGMPEFVQGKVEPYATIIVRFSTQQDLEEFSKVIGQRLNKKSQCTWYPELVPGLDRRKRYVDES